MAQAQELNIKEAGIGTNASWGSNFLVDFPVDALMTMLEKQHRLWEEAGIKVDSVGMGDPMSWCRPDKVEESFIRVKEMWPEINHFSLHVHNGRNMAIASAYAALRVLEPEDTLNLDGAIGGMGGCPYCGNGRATGMIPSEDILHMMEDMGIETGVDLDKLIDCVWMAEEIVGRPCMATCPRPDPGPKRWINSTTSTPPSSRPWSRSSTSGWAPSHTKEASTPTTSPLPVPTGTGWSRDYPHLSPPTANGPGSRTGSQ